MSNPTTVNAMITKMRQQEEDCKVLLAEVQDLRDAAFAVANECCTKEKAELQERIAYLESKAVTLTDVLEAILPHLIPFSPNSKQMIEDVIRILGTKS